MRISLPAQDSLSDYYKTYLKYVPEEDLLKCLVEQQSEINSFLSALPVEKESFQYAPGKWMLKEVVGHLCDTERILSYRALRFSRNDKLPLQGFDENEYTVHANYKSRNLKNITEELLVVRQSTILLFQNMNEEMLDRKGTANESEVTARAILFFIIAHARHHMKVIEERYLQQ
ncbi:MAG: DinB family protein [Bacteroidia bacterium]|nr:DinB family protein [Bacteroidia bacterium]